MEMSNHCEGLPFSLTSSSLVIQKQMSWSTVRLRSVMMVAPQEIQEMDCSVKGSRKWAEQQETSLRLV